MFTAKLTIIDDDGKEEIVTAEGEGFIETHNALLRKAAEQCSLKPSECWGMIIAVAKMEE